MTLKTIHQRAVQRLNKELDRERYQLHLQKLDKELGIEDVSVPVYKAVLTAAAYLLGMVLLVSLLLVVIHINWPAQ